jgi:hypothetical protein
MRFSILFLFLMVSCGKKDSNHLNYGEIFNFNNTKRKRHIPNISLVKPSSAQVKVVYQKEGVKEDILELDLTDTYSQIIHQKLLVSAYKKEVKNINTNFILDNSLLDASLAGCINDKQANYFNEYYENVNNVYKVSLNWEPNFIVYNLDGVTSIYDISYKVLYSSKVTAEKVSKIDRFSKERFFFVDETENRISDHFEKETTISFKRDRLRKIQPGCFFVIITDFKFTRNGKTLDYSIEKTKEDEKNARVVISKENSLRILKGYRGTNFSELFKYNSIPFEVNSTGKVESIDNDNDLLDYFSFNNLLNQFTLGLYNWNFLGSYKRPNLVSLKQGKTYFFVYSRLKDQLQSESNIDNYQFKSVNHVELKNLLPGEKIRVELNANNFTEVEETETDSYVDGVFFTSLNLKAVSLNSGIPILVKRGCLKSVTHLYPLKNQLVNLAHIREYLALRFGVRDRLIMPSYINYNRDTAFYEFSVKESDLDSGAATINMNNKTNRKLDVIKNIIVKPHNKRATHCRDRYNVKNSIEGSQSYREIVQGNEMINFSGYVYHHSIR